MAELLVTISKRRLDELEDLERRLPVLLAEAVGAQKTNRLKMLRERDSADVSLVRARARRYADKHRTTINERRRERKQKVTVGDAGSSVESPKKDGEADGPRPNDGDPKDGDVAPPSAGPIPLEDAGDKKPDAPEPKHKARPKKVDKRHNFLHLV